MQQLIKFSPNTVMLSTIFLLIFAMQLLEAKELPDFTPLVEKNAGAVVNISTVQNQRNTRAPRQQLPDIPEDSPFYDFFRRFFGEIPEGGGQMPFRESASLGSGFIISKDGYIITNNHVVAEADEVIVRMNDRREFVAEIVGKDERSDIAVLKVEADDLPVLKLGDSSRLNVGEWVLAIGSPFGFDASVTAGIVSAIGRSLPNENYVPFIQTDVAINPGNSGGPLFNLDGEVVGVNSQIYSRTGGFMGLSFAVPINVVTNVYQQIRDQGHVSRGWLGVLIQNVTGELAESFGMEKPQGALVAKILPDSPAEKSGLEIGDIIIRFDGQEVSFSSDLPPMVGNTPIGESVPVEILRHGKKEKINITISKLPEETQVALSGTGQDKVLTPPNPLNIVVEDLTNEQIEELALDDGGIYVAEVDPGPAQQAGIRVGDVILLMNNKKVTSIEDFNKILDDLPEGKSIPILVQRRGNPIFLAFKIAD